MYQSHIFLSLILNWEEFLFNANRIESERNQSPKMTLINVNSDMEGRHRFYYNYEILIL